MMSNNFCWEKCYTNNNQNKSVYPWTRDEKRSPERKKKLGNNVYFFVRYRKYITHL